MAHLKQVPANMKSIQPYIKIAEEHDKRDPIIAYWCRLFAIQNALKLNDKSPENSSFLLGLMTWLENIKKEKSQDDGITNEVVAQSLIENYALKLFQWADGEDRAGHFNKNVVKAFYTAGFIFDLLNTFGEPSDEVVHKRKYAKWKSTYIHNCLKNGITPVAGPLAMEGEDEEDELTIPSFPPASSTSDFPMQPQTPYPVGGIFNILPPENQNLPVPGSHAPPSTPNGASQLATMTAEISLNDAETKSSDTLKPEVYQKAHKYCKWAGSALQYEDAPTAIENLQKALRLLTTGQE